MSRGIIALDDFALQAAKGLAARQPRCDWSIPELPGTLPILTDVVAVGRPENVPGGGNTYGVTLEQLQSLIGGGGGGGSAIQYNTNFNGKPSLTNLTVYNYGNYTGAPNGGAAGNTAALTAMFADMAGGPGITGGWGWIPQYSSQVNASASAVIVPDQVLLQGMGGGGHSGGGLTGYHFVINGTGGVFFLSMSGQHSSGGITLANLSFQWLSSTNPLDCAIYNNTWGGRIIDCNFVDCPTAINFGGVPAPTGTGHMGGLGCTAERPVIQYGIANNVPNNATAIILTGEQAQVQGPCEILQQGVGAGGPSGCTAILFGGGTSGGENMQVRNLHLSDWFYGVDFADVNNTGNKSGCQYGTIMACEMQIFGSAINLCTSGPNTSQAIEGIRIAESTMLKSQNSNNGLPIIFIDCNFTGATSGNNNPNTHCSGIDIMGCTIGSNVTSSGSHNGVAQNNQYGIQINGGGSIRVIGGRVNNVGTTAGSDGTANIAITNTNSSFANGPEAVVIEGVDLRPSNFNLGGGSAGASASQWALLVSGTQNGIIQVRNCDMTQYSGSTPTGGPVSVTATINTMGGQGALYINNCPGYNDQNVVINTLANITTGVAYQAYNQGSNSGISYFGPSLFMFTANASGGTLTMNGGTAQTLLASQLVVVYLDSPYEKIQFGGHAPAAVQWLGR